MPPIVEMYLAVLSIVALLAGFTIGAGYAIYRLVQAFRRGMNGGGDA